MLTARKFKVLLKISGKPLISVINNFNVFEQLRYPKKSYSTYGKSSKKSLGNHSVAAETKQFIKSFPNIIDDFVSNPMYDDIPETIMCFKDVLEQTIPTGKKVRPLNFIHVYKRMEDIGKLSSEKIKLMNILGWCIELIQGMTIVIDDIVDNSQTRRGKPCWHKNKNVGSRAVFDSILLENYTYQVLKRYFYHLPMYVPAMELMQQAIMYTSLGQLQDTITLDFNKFSKEYFEALLRFKTVELLFVLPYNLARCLSNKYYGDITVEIWDIFKKFGLFYQAQNDFLDCYDNASLGLKIGNDIEEGKCSWLIVKALEKATSQQRLVLQTHYGRKGSESVTTIKKLYNTLEIPKEYTKYEKEMYSFIERNIDQVSTLFCHEIMFKRLDDVYEQYI